VRNAPKLGEHALDSARDALGHVGTAAEERVSTPNAIAESARELLPQGQRANNELATGQPDAEADVSTPNAIAASARESVQPGSGHGKKASEGPKADEVPS
jgi:hypothetical protein